MPAAKIRSYRKSKKRIASKRRSRRVVNDQKTRRSRRSNRKIKSRRRANSRSRKNLSKRRKSRRISRRKASSRVKEQLKSNPIIKCTFPDTGQELVLKPPSPGSNLPKPPKSKGSTMWINVPFQAGNSLAVDTNNKPYLKTDENGAYEVTLPNYSIKVLLSENEDIAHKLGIDTTGSLAIAVPTGCVATWNPSYKNDINYESVYTINGQNDGNPDGSWMLYAPLELPESPPKSGEGSKPIDNIPAVQRINVDGKRMLKFRLQVPLKYPISGGFIDIQEKLNALEAGQKLRINMMYPPGLSLSEQRTIGVEISKDQVPGTFIEFQLPESLWDQDKRYKMIGEEDADENSDNLKDIAMVVAALTVTVIFVYNIPNMIRVTKALGSLLYSAFDAGLQPIREQFYKREITPPAAGEFQPAIDRQVESLVSWSRRFGNVPKGFEPYNYKGLSKMQPAEQVRWFSKTTIEGTEKNPVSHFGAVFMDIQTWDSKQANGAISKGFNDSGTFYEGMSPEALKIIARDNPVAFSFIGRNAEKPWVWEPNKLKSMLNGIKNQPEKVEQLMISVRAGTSEEKLGELGTNYEAALKDLNLTDRLPTFDDIGKKSSDAKAAIEEGTYTLGQDEGFDIYKAQKDIAEGAQREDGNLYYLLNDLGSHANLGEVTEHIASPRMTRRVSPRLQRLMKRYNSIKNGL